MQFNTTRQTTMHPTRPLEGFLEYVDYAYCALLFNPEIRRVLVLGLGGGSVPKRFLHDFPNVRVDAVEIDPVVVEVAREYFALPADPRLQVYVQDGRVFLKRSPHRYDLIIMDAYSATRYGLAVPRHLTTKEFLEEVRDHLTPNGVLMFNVATYLSRYDNRMVRAVSRTIAAVFPSQYAWDVETTLNTMMLAPKSPHRWSREELMNRAEQLVASGTITLPAFTNRVARLRTGLYRVDDVPVLTDQYAPVDRLMLEPEPE
jgi:spermidine synthase